MTHPGLSMHGIRREIAGVLVLKVLALAILYFVFFADRPSATPSAVASHVLSN